MQESLLIKLPVIIGDLFLLNLSWIFALTLFPQPAYVAHSLEIFACLNICFIPGLSWFGVILSSRIVPYEEIIRRVFYVVLCHIGFFTVKISCCSLQLGNNSIHFCLRQFTS